MDPTQAVTAAQPLANTLAAQIPVALLVGLICLAAMWMYSRSIDRRDALWQAFLGAQGQLMREAIAEQEKAAAAREEEFRRSLERMEATLENLIAELRFRSGNPQGGRRAAAV